MRRLSLAIALALFFLAGSLQAQQAQRGMIKKVDAEKGTVTITSDGKDYEVTLTPETILRGPDDLDLPSLKEKPIPAGTAVMFRTQQRGDKLALVGMKVAGQGAQGQAAQGQGAQNQKGQKGQKAGGGKRPDAPPPQDSLPP